MKQVHKINTLPISSYAIYIMLFGATLLLLQLGYMSFDILRQPVGLRLSTVLLYQKCFHYILLELTILLGGSFLFDITARELKNES